MITLSTDSLRGYDLNRKFELSKKAGFDGIDLVVNFGLFDTYDSKYLNELTEHYKLPIQAISAPDQIATSKIEKLVDLAKAVNAKVLVIQPPRITDFKTSSWYKKEIPRLREEHNISIALENAPSGTILGFIPERSLSNIKELRKFKHVALDTSRLGEKGQDIIRTFEATKEFLVHIHLSNYKDGKKYQPPQEGVLPLESLLTKLGSDQFPGAIAIKVKPKTISAGNEKILLEKLVEIKEYCLKYLNSAPSKKEETQTENEDLNSEE